MNLLYIVLCIIVLYTVLFLTLNLEDNNKWLIYIESLYRFGVIFAVMALIMNNIQTSETNKKLYIDRINDASNLGFITINKALIDHYPESLELAKELHEDLNIKFRENIDPDKKQLIEMNICILIFQSIENNLVFMSNIRDIDGGLENMFYDAMLEWIIRWRIWFKSPILINIWKTNQRNFSGVTRNFINKYIINDTTIYKYDQIIQIIY